MSYTLKFTVHTCTSTIYDWMIVCLLLCSCSLQSFRCAKQNGYSLYSVSVFASRRTLSVCNWNEENRSRSISLSLWLSLCGVLAILVLCNRLSLRWLDSFSSFSVSWDVISIFSQIQYENEKPKILKRSIDSSPIVFIYSFLFRLYTTNCYNHAEYSSKD